jgi:hypothetical protein
VSDRPPAFLSAFSRWYFDVLRAVGISVLVFGAGIAAPSPTLSAIGLVTALMLTLYIATSATELVINSTLGLAVQRLERWIRVAAGTAVLSLIALFVWGVQLAVAELIVTLVRLKQ